MTIRMHLALPESQLLRNFGVDWTYVWSFFRTKTGWFLSLYYFLLSGKSPLPPYAPFAIKHLGKIMLPPQKNHFLDPKTEFWTPQKTIKQLKTLKIIVGLCRRTPQAPFFHPEITFLFPNQFWEPQNDLGSPRNKKLDSQIKKNIKKLQGLVKY